MRSVELVCHCYAEKHDVFARLLTAQLSSLVLWPPKCSVRVTVFTAPSDPAFEVVKSELGMALWSLPQPVRLMTFAAEKQLLFRRSILRNKAAKETTADIVWFADADYLFGEGCLDRLAERTFKTRLVFPSEYRVHRSHAIGDAEIERIKPGKLFTPDLTLFEPSRVGFAIGGLQIVSGDTAREFGYLNGDPKWQKPVDPALGFQDTKEDKHFRKAMGGSSPINLPRLYRMRHSVSAFESAEKRLAQTAGKA